LPDYEIKENKVGFRGSRLSTKVEKGKNKVLKKNMFLLIGYSGLSGHLWIAPIFNSGRATVNAPASSIAVSTLNAHNSIVRFKYEKLRVNNNVFNVLDFSGKQLWTFQESRLRKLYRSLQYNLQFKRR